MSIEGVITRRATVADAAAIARVHTSSWQAAYRGLVPQDHLDSLSWRDRHDMWTRILEEGGTVVLATAGGAVQAFAGFGPARDPDLRPDELTELYSIYAVPSAWHRGTGGTLLAAVVRLLPEETAGLTAWVLTGNARGRAFYERSGFAPDGAVKEAHIGGAVLPEVRYRLALPATPSP